MDYLQRSLTHLLTHRLFNFDTQGGWWHRTRDCRGQHRVWQDNTRGGPREESRLSGVPRANDSQPVSGQTVCTYVCQDLARQFCCCTGRKNIRNFVRSTMQVRMICSVNIHMTLTVYKCCLRYSTKLSYSERWIINATMKLSRLLTLV